MAILSSRNADSPQIVLEGAVDVGAAAELKTAMEAALAEARSAEESAGKKVWVRLAGATDVDVTAFQLLWAAEREAERSGVELKLVGPLAESVRNHLASLGLPGLTVAE